MFAFFFFLVSYFTYLSKKFFQYKKSSLIEAKNEKNCVLIVKVSSVLQCTRSANFQTFLIELKVH